MRDNLIYHTEYIVLIFECLNVHEHQKEGGENRDNISIVNKDYNISHAYRI